MKTNHLIKTLTLLFFLIILGCQKENVLKMEDSIDEAIEKVNQDIPVSKYVEGDKIPNILEHLASKTNTTYNKISDLNGKIHYNKVKINMKHAMEVVTKGKNTNYSFDLFLDDMPKRAFYSLIVSKRQDGTLEEPYVIRYKMTKDDFENYIANDMDFRYFRAKQHFYTFDSFFSDTQKGMTARSGDCGENTIAGGSPTGGGTSGNGGGGITAPGETFTSNFNGTMVNSNFGTRQNADLYSYEVTINTSDGSSTTVTSGYSATVSPVVTNSSGVVLSENTIPTAGNNWINFSYTVNTNANGSGSLPCYKIIGVGDQIFWQEVDCPPTDQLKGGSTSRSTSTLSDCYVPSGGVAINVTLLAVEINRMLGGIELSDDELAFLTQNQDEALQVFKFLRFNDSPEERAFAAMVVEARTTNDYTHLLSQSLFNQNPYSIWKRLSQAEKNLIKEIPLEAYGVFQNRKIAEDETRARFNNNGRNDKSDAFRHAYYTLINSKVVGISTAELFSNAHESEVPNALLKEKQMDLFNNNVGHQAISGNGDKSLSELSNIIFTKLVNGNLRYLSPLNFVSSPQYDANRDGVQDCPNCANGITSATVLTPTNQ